MEGVPSLSGGDNDDMPVTGNSLPNFTKWEQEVVNRLTGSDPRERNRVLEKFEEWFKALECRFPEHILHYDADSSTAGEIKQHFSRVWKMLICTVLITPQDPIATLLSIAVCDLLTALGSKPNLVSLFTERFLIVLIEEWSWINPLFETVPTRVMVLKHFVLKSFQLLSQHGWQDDYVVPFINTLRVHLFNHHPPPPRSTRAASKTPVPVLAPVELQLSFTSGILEYLPKSEPKAVQLILFFLNELVETKSDLVVNEIHQCILSHILKPSDVVKTENNVKSLETSLKEIELNDASTTAPSIEAGAEDQHSDSNGNLSKSDVSGQIDFTEVILQLKRCAPAKNKKELVKGLLIRFESLQDGYFPPSVYFNLRSEAVLTPTSTTTVVVAGNRRKIRTKPKMLNSGTSLEVPETKRGSQYLNDPELLDHIGDNYMSFLVEILRGPISDSDSASALLLGEDHKRILKEPKLSANLVKRRKLVFETNSDQALGIPMDTTGDSENSEHVRNVQDHEVEVSPVSLNGTSGMSTRDDDLEEPRYEGFTPKRRKLARQLSDVKVDTTEATSTPIIGSLTITPTPFPKSVRFVLATNLEHDHEDYPESIERNPDLPYDSARLPKNSLLKSKSPKISAATVHWKKKAAAAATASDTPLLS